MIPEIGNFAIVMAMVLALVQAVVPLAGATLGNARWMAVARPGAYGQFGFLLLAFVILAYCFVSNDFTVAYVANNSNTLLPLGYKISAVWGGHEGSLLLWALVLAGWTAAVALWSQHLPRLVASRVLGVMGIISVGFNAFLLFTSNPFDRLLPDFPPDGGDLNPLLQDPGLIVHPPMLYMGYVGFSVAFAFAIAGLLGGRLDSAWARWSRPWTTVAWCFLTLGIALGSWWAYYELGWGGWWFWDPVENASFMPWLAGTALMHSLAVTEKRGVFKAWTVLLAILTFSLSLLGTFLVRSGVLTSVHAFAADPTRGFFILVFLLLVVGSSLLLFAIRAPSLNSESQYDLFSREVLLLANNIILICATGVVLVGTLSPILFDVLELGKISVGEPFFNTTFAPVTLVLMVFTGIGPLVNWKRHQFGLLKTTLLQALVISAATAAICLWLFDAGWNWMVFISLLLCVWVVWHALCDLWKKVRTAKAGPVAGLRRLSLSYRGMVIAHIGLAVTVAGVAMTANFDVERDVRMSAGDEVNIGPYHFQFRGVEQVQGPNYEATLGTVTVSKNGAPVAVLTPEKRHYHVRRDMMTEASIDAGFTRDLYVALGEPLNDGSWAVRIYFKPYMRWVWGGGVIMALGGFVAMSDRRYRIKVRQKITRAAGQLAGGSS
ncbi:MAG: heme lyase CcmF/NrfE family subunit [Pseudomonadota bacterium]|nr:heme lyase CcmF/NrfE family subunit [Pseudomonadota bacterium]